MIATRSALRPRTPSRKVPQPLPGEQIRLGNFHLHLPAGHGVHRLQPGLRRPLGAVRHHRDDRTLPDPRPQGEAAIRFQCRLVDRSGQFREQQRRLGQHFHPPRRPLADFSRHAFRAPSTAASAEALCAGQRSKRSRNCPTIVPREKTKARAGCGTEAVPSHERSEKRPVICTPRWCQTAKASTTTAAAAAHHAHCLHPVTRTALLCR